MWISDAVQIEVSNTVVYFKGKIKEGLELVMVSLFKYNCICFFNR
jgi:hypothetical protein